MSRRPVFDFMMELIRIDPPTAAPKLRNHCQADVCGLRVGQTFLSAHIDCGCLATNKR